MTRCVALTEIGMYRSTYAQRRGVVFQTTLCLIRNDRNDIGVPSDQVYAKMPPGVRLPWAR